ncbi:hypothetical protein FK85_03000 [Halorubrum saccharovorum]|uniref:Uncharacterized protein n=1 Tax=Halorubrum saccharovorum TaxID=2248 RepID=A0A081EXN7_9EURY|nr:hypothetical protein FK85_03000 [Halorubrum saccharovorum]
MVRLSLVARPVFTNQHPDINIAATVSLTASNASIQNDSEHVIKFSMELVGRILYRRVKLRLGNSEEWIVWDSEPVTVDLDKSAGSVVFFDNEIIPRKCINRFAYRRSRVANCVSKVCHRKRLIVMSR